LKSGNSFRTVKMQSHSILSGRMRWMGCLVVILAFATGCQGSTQSPPEEMTREPLTSPTASSPTDTQVSLNLATLTPTAVPELTPTPSPIPAEPDFSLAENPQRSISPWRPPAYPVPWVPGPYDHFYFSPPISAFDIDSAFSTYGYGGVFFENVVHTGIDIPGDIGTPILAAGAGTVIYAGQGVYRGGYDNYDDPYGKAVVIKHDFSYQGEPLYTLYAHMDEIQVKKGQNVLAGDQIGLMGDTGKTTGPHLHFEVRVGKNEYFSTRNPDLWISPPQGWGVLVGQVLTYAGRPLERQLIYLRPAEGNPALGPIEDSYWMGYSYQNESINIDPYYRENFTIANIPAGRYIIDIPATSVGYRYTTEVEIKPGLITYFKFNIWKGFTDKLPATPEIIFSPSP
jgi:murein DD-endopeptidase MepM/ murein hydrolase activator NlpD